MLPSVPASLGGLGSASARKQSPYSSVILIAEVTPASKVGSISNLASSRYIVLSGPSLPHMGASWEGKFQLKTTWYQGNPQGSQQVMGPQEMPSKWSGEWHRTMLGSQAYGGPGARAAYVANFTPGAVELVVDPDALRDYMEQLFRGGTLLDVSWISTIVTTGSSSAPLYEIPVFGIQSPFGLLSQITTTQQRKIVRRGRASAWAWHYERIHDIKWDITFDWISRGVGLPPFQPTGATSVKAATASVSAAITAVINGVGNSTSIGTNVSGLSLANLLNLAKTPAAIMQQVTQSINSLSSTITQLGNVASTVATAPAVVAGGLVNAMVTMVSTCTGFLDQFGQVPRAFNSVSSQVAAIAKAGATIQGAVDPIAQAANTAQNVINGRLAGQQFSTPTNSAGSVLPSKILATYITVSGDTPYRVSMKFYNTADNALAILKFNDLPWTITAFAPGTQLFIPNPPL